MSMFKRQAFVLESWVYKIAYIFIQDYISQVIRGLPFSEAVFNGRRPYLSNSLDCQVYSGSNTFETVNLDYRTVNAILNDPA